MFLSQIKIGLIQIGLRSKDKPHITKHIAPNSTLRNNAREGYVATNRCVKGYLPFTSDRLWLVDGPGKLSYITSDGPPRPDSDKSEPCQIESEIR